MRDEGSRVRSARPSGAAEGRAAVGLSPCSLSLQQLQPLRQAPVLLLQGLALLLQRAALLLQQVHVT